MPPSILTDYRTGCTSHLYDVQPLSIQVISDKDYLLQECTDMISVEIIHSIVILRPRQCPLLTV